MYLISVLFSVLATDTPTLAIILTFAGTILTSIIGAFVAVNLNKTEKKKSAETTLEKTLRERITLRDEEIADVRRDLEQSQQIISQLVEDNAELKLERDKAIQQRDRLYMAIVEQRAEEKVHNGDS